MAARTVLFDLDGTLTDPFEGITRSIIHALERLGRIAPNADELRWCIGPPLQASFRELLATDDDARITEAVAIYRERYSGIGKFENVAIEGISELLGWLSARGYRLAVATSKLQSYAVDIVAHFGLMQFFEEVYGSEPDGRLSNKADLIEFILKMRNIEPGHTLMIGDRMHDIVGAVTNGVAGIGVLWGYGDRAELERAGAAAVAETPAGLYPIIEKKLPMT